MLSKIPAILEYGLPGLIFLFAFLSFLLLKGEQTKPQPRQELLNIIKYFMWVNVLCGILVVLNGIFYEEPEKTDFDILGKWEMRWESVGFDNIQLVFKKDEQFFYGTYSWLPFNKNQRLYGCIKGTLNGNVFDGEWFESDNDICVNCEKKSILNEGQITLVFSTDYKMCVGKYSRLRERNQKKYVWSGAKL